MAKNKKSFILYCDIVSTVSKLPDEKAGKLFKHILEYVNDNDPDGPEDLLLSVAFEPIKQQLKRDLEKYKSIINRNKENGKKGGRPRKQGIGGIPNNPVGYSGNPNKPKKADSVNALDLVNDNVIDSDNKDQENRKPKKRFSPPSQSEIIEYSISKDLNTNGFFDYYESNGWMVGKNKMKDWKASARGWSGRQYNSGTTKSATQKQEYKYQPSSEFAEENPSFDENIIAGEFERLEL